MEKWALALLLMLGGPSPAAELPAAGSAQASVDFSRPFTLQLELAIPDGQVDLRPLYDALDAQGFRTTISVRQGSDATAGPVLIADRLRAWRHDDLSQGEVAALRTRIGDLVRPFGGALRWSFRQNGVEGAL